MRTREFIREHVKAGHPDGEEAGCMICVAAKGPSEGDVDAQGNLMDDWALWQRRTEPDAAR